MNVATAAVVVGLLGEYRKFIFRFLRSLRLKNWKYAWRNFLLLIFPLVVVGGVAGELWINFQVSLRENSWERSQLPRSLTQEQKIQISKRLKPYKGMKVDIIIYAQGSSSDTVSLSKAFNSIFVKAHWRPRVWISLGAFSESGVLVSTFVKATENTESAAKAIIDSLNSENIKTEKWVPFRTGAIQEVPGGVLNGPIWEADKVAPIRILICTKP